MKKNLLTKVITGVLLGASMSFSIAVMMPAYSVSAAEKDESLLSCTDMADAKDNPRITFSWVNEKKVLYKYKDGQCVDSYSLNYLKTQGLDNYKYDEKNLYLTQEFFDKIYIGLIADEYAQYVQNKPLFSCSEMCADKGDKSVKFFWVNEKKRLYKEKNGMVVDSYSLNYLISQGCNKYKYDENNLYLTQEFFTKIYIGEVADEYAQYVH